MTNSRRLFAGFACALAAGGAVYLVYFDAPKTASSAAAARRVAAAKLARASFRAREPAGPAANELLADKPEPGNGYSPEFDDELLAVVRQLVARSPEAALAWADRTSAPEWRDIMCKIVVQVWAESEPAAALDWAQSVHGDKREIAIEAALTGLAQRPDAAVALGRKLLADEPELANAHGTILLGALVRDGQFASAAELAGLVPEDMRAASLSLVFARWAEHDPAAAAGALSYVSGQETYAQAYRAVLKGWAGADPQALADYALTLAAGEFRATALQNAFSQWSEQDPAALAGWLANLPPSPEFDAGAAAFLARSDGANRDTRTALLWAQSIGESGLRYAAVNRVLQEESTGN